MKMMAELMSFASHQAATRDKQVALLRTDEIQRQPRRPRSQSLEQQHKAARRAAQRWGWTGCPIQLMLPFSDLEVRSNVTMLTFDKD